MCFNKEGTHSRPALSLIATLCSSFHGDSLRLLARQYFAYAPYQKGAGRSCFVSRRSICNKLAVSQEPFPYVLAIR